MIQPIVYIVASKRNGALYTGVTSDLIRRIYEHKNELIEGFTKEYNCKVLVYFEVHSTMESAIMREKQIKGWLRKKKIKLIEDINPNWADLYDSIL